jgi:1D-myo-inositol-triphosphate 3-kinase
MDVKLGCRTFLEDQVTDPKLRTDLLEKMMKLDPQYATEEERTQGKCSKLRYMQLREKTSTTASLHFRIEGVMLAGDPVKDVDFKKLNDRPAASDAIHMFVSRKITHSAIPKVSRLVNTTFYHLVISCFRVSLSFFSLFFLSSLILSLSSL